MKRRNFITNVCFTCLAGSTFAIFFDGCASAMIQGSVDGAEMTISLAEFEELDHNNVQFKKYVIVHNKSLQFPICVYRFNENTYEALWMQCTHQGTELQVFGDRLQCPAHGSEFSSNGTVLHGPASANLRTFPVVVDNNLLRISLR